MGGYVAVANQQSFGMSDSGGSSMASLSLYLLTPSVSFSFLCLTLFSYSSSIGPKQFVYPLTNKSNIDRRTSHNSPLQILAHISIYKNIHMHK